MRRLAKPTPDLRYFIAPESGELIDLADLNTKNPEAQQVAS
jgi:hypothetical protein